MMFLDQKKGFLGYDALYQTKPKIVVVPFGLEKTVSYGKGTKNGPQEIIKASHQVELFDEELNKEPYREIGIQTLKPFKIKNKIIDALNQIAEINNNIIESKKIPIILGGEHSITPGSIKPFSKKLKRLTLVHFDAHADLRDEYEGEKNSHASAIKRCLDYNNIDVISIGIRNLSKNEMRYYENNKNRVKIFWANNKKNWDLPELYKNLKQKNVYITFDVDAFDAGIMPATGTPEPGGLFWDETLQILKNVCKISNVVGGDIVELSPIKNFDAYNFLVAKLVYKIISYIFEFKKEI